MMSVDPQFRDKANLSSLKKLDQSVTDIIASATHASMYQFEPSFSRWKKIECEGPLFIVKRNTEPRFGLIVANRLALENFIHGVDSSFHVEIVDPYIIFKSNPTPGAQPIIHGLWLSDDTERQNIFKLLSKCVKAQSIQPSSQTVFQQEKKNDKVKQQTSVPATIPQQTTTTNQKAANKSEPSQNVKDDFDFLTPGMILGESNVPKLGSGQDQNGGVALDLDAFKASLRELLEDDSFLASLHAKYSAVATSSK